MKIGCITFGSPRNTEPFRKLPSANLNISMPPNIKPPARLGGIYKDKDPAFIAWSLREHAKYQRTYGSNVILDSNSYEEIAGAIEKLLNFKEGKFTMPDSWTIKQVSMDKNGYDNDGWYWGLGEKLWYITDGIDSLTVRADSAEQALAIVKAEGWPPKRLGRFNWGREHNDGKYL